MGRFITPDWSASPVSVPYAEFSDPQSLNHYSYARNRPLTYVDRNGHCVLLGIDCVVVAAAVVIVAGIAWGLHKLKQHEDAGWDAGRKAARAREESLDAAGAGDAEKADRKDAKATEYEKEALKEAQEAGKEGTQIPGTSTGGDIGLGMTDAVGGLAVGAAVDAEQKSIDRQQKERQQREQQQRRKRQEQQQNQQPPPPPPPPCMPDRDHPC